MPTKNTTTPERDARAERLKRERDADLDAIYDAIQPTEWAVSADTEAYLGEYLKTRIDELDDEVRDAFTGDDPMPAKEVARSHHRRKTLLEVNAHLRSMRNSIERAVQNAMEREREVKAEGEMFYTAPEWPNTALGWIAAASKGRAKGRKKNA